MNDFAPQTGQQVGAQQFLWRDRNGQVHTVATMATRHLFFTLRMIWNHSAPPGLRIAPYQHYRFSAFYSAAYMKAAVKAIALELSGRADLQPYFSQCLAFMRAHFTVWREESERLLPPGD